MKQLNPPLPVVTPKGKAWAHLVIDYGPEADLIWVCFQDETGECWSWPNKEIKLQENLTLSAIRQKIIARQENMEQALSLLRKGNP